MSNTPVLSRLDIIESVERDWPTAFTRKEIEESIDEIAKQESIEFANWIAKKGNGGWEQFRSGKWGSITSGEPKTTEELYEMYLTEQRNKQE